MCFWDARIPGLVVTANWADAESPVLESPLLEGLQLQAAEASSKAGSSHVRCVCQQPRDRMWEPEAMHGQGGCAGDDNEVGELCEAGETSVASQGRVIAGRRWL